VTSVRSVEDRLLEQLKEAERHGARADALRDVASALLAGTSIDGGLRLAARHSRDLAGADLAVVIVPNPTPAGTASVSVAVPDEASGPEGTQLQLADSAVGVVLSTASPLCVDSTTDPGFDGLLARQWAAGPWLLLPLAASGEVLGVLAVGRAAGAPTYDDGDVALLGTFAEEVARLLHTGRAQARALDQAGAAEDERIASVLHDQVIRRVYAVGLGLHAARAMTADPFAVARIDDAVDELDDVVRSIRSAVFADRSTDRRADRSTESG
jgi:GAF domain-containing protein